MIQWILGVLLLAAIGVGGWKWIGETQAEHELATTKLTLDKRTAERDAARDDLKQSRANTTTVETALATCNSGIEDAKKAGEKSAAEANAKRAKVEQENKSLADRVRVLLLDKRPADMNACQNAERLIDAEIDAGVDGGGTPGLRNPAK